MAPNTSTTTGSSRGFDKRDLGRVQQLVPTKPQKPIQLPRVRRRFFLLFLFVSVVLAAIIPLVIQVLQQSRKPKQEPQISLPGSTTFTLSRDGTFFNPSIYATDPEVLRIEEFVKTVDKEITAVVLHEADLNPPLLLFDVHFREE